MGVEGAEEALAVEAAVAGMTVIAADLTVAAAFVAGTVAGLLPLQPLWRLPAWTALPEVEIRPPDRPGVVEGFVGSVASTLVAKDPGIKKINIVMSYLLTAIKNNYKFIRKMRTGFCRRNWACMLADN